MLKKWKVLIDKLPLWRLTTLRRKLYELAGSDRYSIPSTQGICEQLDKYFKIPGFFVEAGAVDGFFESNTYHLERLRHWNGILIEPVPAMYGRIKFNRPRSYRFNCALGAPSKVGQKLLVKSAHAMSKVIDEQPNSSTSAAFCSVPVRTLTSILDEVSPNSVDLLSLDVEGYEIEALKGLDFSKWLPRYMLIECLTPDSKVEMDRFLSGQYRCIDQFTYRDFFYQALT